MADDEDKPDEPSLRVVPLHPDAWASPQWLSTGENVVAEVNRKHGDHFIVTVGGVYWWNEHLWVPDERHMLERSCAEVCRTIAAAKKKTVREKLESAKFISGTVSRLRQELAQPFAIFDQGELINTPAATFLMNRDTFEPRPHRRLDYCTRMTKVTPVKMPTPKWDAFLRRIFDDDCEMVDYVQRVLGYCISPYTDEQVFFFCYGTGQNGKGTLLHVVAELIGDYAHAATAGFFQQSKFEQHPEEMAQLRGKHLVIAPETEQGRAWDEAKLKMFTGGDAIRARYMRQDSFEFHNKAKLVISGNHKPRIRDVGPAIMRRLQLIPFLVQIPEAERDRKLEQKLIAQEGPGILWSLLNGFAQWREHGLAPPLKVLDASQEYFEEQDDYGQWIADECELGASLFSFTMTLWASWKTWADARNLHPGTQKDFREAIGKRLQETRADHTNKGNGFFGIRLKPKYSDQ